MDTVERLYSTGALVTPPLLAVMFMLPALTPVALGCSTRPPGR
jgi:hypothetical protein